MAKSAAELHSWGCGAHSGPHWFMLPWTGKLQETHITVKELAPIVIAAIVWGQEWRGQVLFKCDNMAVVISIIHSGSSRNPQAMQLRRCLAFLAAKRPQPLFKFSVGRPLTRGRLVEKVRVALQKAGVDCKFYSGHSIRIRAATTAANRVWKIPPSRCWAGGKVTLTSSTSGPLGNSWQSSLAV